MSAISESHDNEIGWTFNTLKIHLLAIMDEREKAHEKALNAALTAVKDGKANVLALSLAGSAVIATVVAIATFFAMIHK